MICDLGYRFPEQTVTVLFQLTGAHRCLSSITLPIAEQRLRPLGPRPLLPFSDISSGRLFSVPTVSKSSRNLVPVCASTQTPTSVSIFILQVRTVHSQNERKQALVFTLRMSLPQTQALGSPESSAAFRTPWVGAQTVGLRGGRRGRSSGLGDLWGCRDPLGDFPSHR